MPFNGSGTFTPSVNWTTEAASPPIEISKLDTQDVDMAAGLSNCQTLDGQSSPTADLPMNGHKHTNVGAASALTHYGRVSEIIDQDYIYYVDSGSANTYAITPSPSIGAYEEGQRFVVRIANANSGASTLNVNGLGAIAIQTPDAVALASGALLAGGIYEFTYDANTTPDRWVLTSPPSDLHSAAALTGTLPAISGANLTNLNGTNVASGTVADARLSSQVVLKDGAISSVDNGDSADPGYRGLPQNLQANDYTCVLSDAGKHIRMTATAKTITIPANGSVAYPIGTVLTFTTDSAVSATIAITTDAMILAGAGSTGSRTLAADSIATAIKLATATWMISGAGLS